MNNLKRNVKIYSAGLMTIIYFFTNVTPLLAADAQPQIQQDGSGQQVAVVDPDNQHYDRNFGAQIGQIPASDQFEKANPLSPVVDDKLEVHCTAYTKECGYDSAPEPVSATTNNYQALNPVNPEDRANIFEAGQIFGAVPAYMTSEYQKDGSTKYSFYDADKKLLGSKIQKSYSDFCCIVYRPQIEYALDEVGTKNIVKAPYDIEYFEAETWYDADGTKLDASNNEYLNTPEFVRNAAKDLARNLPSSLKMSIFTAIDGSYGIRIDNLDSATAGKPGAFESITVKFRGGKLGEDGGVTTLPEVESIQIQFTGRNLDQNASDALLDSARQLVRSGISGLVGAESAGKNSGNSLIDAETLTALELVSKMQLSRIRAGDTDTLRFKLNEVRFEIKYADGKTEIAIKNPILQALFAFVKTLADQLGKGYSVQVLKNQDGFYHVSVIGAGKSKYEFYDYSRYEKMNMCWGCGGSYQPAQLDFDLKFTNGRLEMVDGSFIFRRAQYYYWYVPLIEEKLDSGAITADELIFRGMMRILGDSGLTGTDQLIGALTALVRSSQPQQIDVGGVTNTFFSVDGQDYLLRSKQNLLSAEKITAAHMQQLNQLISFVRDAGYYLQPNAAIKITGLNADGTYSMRIERKEEAAKGDFVAMTFRVVFTESGVWAMQAGTFSTAFNGYVLPEAAILALIDSLSHPSAPMSSRNFQSVLGELAKVHIESVNTTTGITVFSRDGFQYEIKRTRKAGVFHYGIQVHVIENMVDLGNGLWLRINANSPLAAMLLQKLKSGELKFSLNNDYANSLTFEQDGVSYQIAIFRNYWQAPEFWYVEMIQSQTADGLITYQYFDQNGFLYSQWKRFYKQYSDGSSLEQYFYGNGTVSWERRINSDKSSVEKSFFQDGKVSFQSDKAADGSTHSRYLNSAGQITNEYWYAVDGTYSWAYYSYADVNGEQKLVRSVISSNKGQLSVTSDYIYSSTGVLIRIERKDANNQPLSKTEIDYAAKSAVITLVNGIAVKVNFTTRENLMTQISDIESGKTPQAVTDYLIELKKQIGSGFKIQAELQNDGTYRVVIVRSIECPAGALCMPRMSVAGDFDSLAFKLSRDGVLDRGAIEVQYYQFEIDDKLLFEGLRKLLAQSGKSGLNLDISRDISEQEIFKAMTEILISEKDASGVIFFSRAGSDYKVYRDENGFVVAEKLLPTGALPVSDEDLAIVSGIFIGIKYQMMTDTGCGTGDIVCLRNTGITYYDEDGSIVGFKNIGRSEFESADHTKIYEYSDLIGTQGKGIKGITFVFAEKQPVHVAIDYNGAHQYPIGFKAAEAAVADLLESVEVRELTLKNFESESGYCIARMSGSCSWAEHFSLESDLKIYHYVAKLVAAGDTGSASVVKVEMLSYEDKTGAPAFTLVTNMPDLSYQDSSAFQLMEKIKNGEIAGYYDYSDDDEEEEKKRQSNQSIF